MRDHSVFGPSARHAVALLLAGAAALGTCNSLAAQWVKGAYLTTPGINCPPFVYVAMTDTPNVHEGFGTDAGPDANRNELDLGSPGRTLMFMHRDRPQPVTIFPIAGFAYTGLGLHAPYSSGSVHEPTVYHDAVNDQYWVIFSFATYLSPVSGNMTVTKPCELYAINITAAVNNPTGFDNNPPLNENTLPVVKLTNAARTSTDLKNRSFNPRLMDQFYGIPNSSVWWIYGIDNHFETNTGACVVDEEHGPVLYFASNERRCDGEAMKAGDLNFTATSVSLINQREIQHFGTTSMISFFESPAGVAGSYRSNTENIGQWGIFEFRSDEAQWQTVSGYANQSNIADHNGTMISIGDDPANTVMAISRYYVGNNEGFGTIILVPYDPLQIGRNIDDGHEHIENVGALPSSELNLFPEISMFQDQGSSVGKFSHPAVGRAATSKTAVELFLTYSRPVSHGAGPYHARLVVVTNITAPIPSVLNQFQESSPSSVLRHDGIHAFSMRPILTQAERFGYRHRVVMPEKGRVDSSRLSGLPTGLFPSGLENMPVAQVTAGPIYKTDVKAMSRRRPSAYGSQPYFDPSTDPRSQVGSGRVFWKVAGLTKDLPHGYLETSESILNDDVWGIRIFVTDAQVRKVVGYADNAPMLPGSRWGYLHHDSLGSGELGRPIAMERYRHLSDVPADDNGMVNFYVPANVPVKFFLLHKDGTVLAQHRNHHSFAPGQLENRCTGCHQHVSPTPGIATTPTPPFNTLTQYGKYGWSQGGAATFAVTTRPNTPPASPALPTGAVPEFKADIWPILDSECRSCHKAGGVGVGGLNLEMDHDPNIDTEVEVWAWLHKKQLINRRLGAAKSPFAWYFTGVKNESNLRLDGEPNSRYRSTSSSGWQIGSGSGFYPSRYWITTEATNPLAKHSGITNRSDAYKVVEWIDAGAPIDHDGTELGSPPYPTRGTNGDGYQIGVSVKLDAFNSPILKIGYWDVDANVTTVEVKFGETTPVSNTVQGNGVLTYDLSPYNPSANMLTPITIVVIDAADNRVRLQKSYKQLLVESETHRGLVDLSVNGRTFGQSPLPTSVEFTVKAGPSMANCVFVVARSLSIHAGLPWANNDIWVLGTYDPIWLWPSLGSPVSVLNGAGTGTLTWPVPSGLPAHVELNCQAVVLRTSSPLSLAKSNFQAIHLR